MWKMGIQKRRPPSALRMESLATWTTLLFLACGSGPKTRVDEAILQDIPVSQKQGMLDARAAMDRANEERNLAEARLNALKSEREIAEAGREQAKLEVSKDQARLDLAEKRKSMDMIREARERLRVSQMAVTASNARLEWLAQREKAMKAALNLAEAHQRVASAQYELEKARLAVRENRRPSEDFQVSKFDQQVSEMQRRQQSAEADLQAQRAQADQLENRYAELAQQYNQQRSQVPGQPPALILPLPQTTMKSQAPGSSSSM